MQGKSSNPGYAAFGGYEEADGKEILLQALPQALLVVNDEGLVRYANLQAEQFFATSSSMMCGQALSKLAPSCLPLLPIVRRAQQTKQACNVHGVIFPPALLGADTQESRQETRKANVSIASVNGEGHWLIMVYPWALEHRLSRRQRQQESSHGLSTMAMVLSHEMKTPLAGIDAAAQLLAQDVQGEQQDIVRLIREEARRMVRYLHNLDGIFQNASYDTMASTNIHEILDRVCQLVQQEGAANITIQKNYDPSLPTVWGCGDSLMRVFLNIVTNAVEAHQDAATRAAPAVAPTIKISTAYRSTARLVTPGGQKTLAPIEVSFHDNGPGIPQDIMAHILEPFMTTKSKGTGLGLALASRLISDHGGFFDYSSEKGNTLFRVCLPVG